jgi:hypothetical protein
MRQENVQPEVQAEVNNVTTSIRAVFKLALETIAAQPPPGSGAG